MNWKNEATEKLRHYDAMRQALENIPMEIARLESEARSIRSVRTDATPVKGGGCGREEILLNNLTQREQLRLQLEQTQAWVHTADRGLGVLSPEEKLILHRLFMYPERGALDRLCSELGVEQSSIYRKRDRALRRFTLALYGATEEL